MNDLDKLVKEGLVPSRAILGGQKNRVGIRVTENGKRSTNTLSTWKVPISPKKRALSSELHHPLGIVRPYAVVERSTLE